jgi:hypothetical protein
LGGLPMPVSPHASFWYLHSIFYVARFLGAPLDMVDVMLTGMLWKQNNFGSRLMLHSQNSEGAACTLLKYSDDLIVEEAISDFLDPG